MGHTTRASLTVLLAWLTCATAALADDEPAKPAESPAATRITVTTVEDQKHEATTFSLAGGIVTLGTDPAKSVPIDELKTVKFQAPPPPTEAKNENKDAASAGEKAKERPATIDLEGSQTVHCHRALLADDALTVATVWHDVFPIPLLHVRGLLFNQATAEAKTRYAAARDKPSGDDLVIVAAKDAGLTEIMGQVKRLDDTRLQLQYEGQERSIQRDRVQAIVFAAHPAVRSPTAPYQVVLLSSGEVLSGAWHDVSQSHVTLQTAWGAALAVPIRLVAEITGRNGKLVYLSDLDPSSVEQVPYFGRVVEYRRDQGWDGGALRIKKHSYAKGLAVHSRCVLVYALDEQFAMFKTDVGFDDSTSDRGRVACRVLADGRELFAEADLRSGGEPRSLELPLDGVKQLTLEIDFGQDADILDRVIWGNARLFRK